MIEEILTEQEDQILEQVKALFYYPPQGGLYQSVTSLLGSIEPERQAEIITLALGQIGFEQTLRRQYVLGSLYTNTDLLSLAAQENMVLRIAQLSVGATPPTIQSGDNPQAFQATGAVTQEILTQAQTFQVVSGQLADFEAIRRLSPQVQSIYRSLKKISGDELSDLQTRVKSFIDQLAGQGEKIFDLNPEVPAPLVVTLKKAGLDLTIAHYRTIGEKLRFLGILLLISTLILQGSEQPTPLTENDELLGIGRLMVAQDITFDDSEI